MAEYIDRKMVIDIINTTCPDFNIPEINDSWAHKLTVIIRETLIELVKQAPAADVRENKSGEWINHISDIFPADSTIECSLCHAEQPCYIDDNYCSNCGADMRKTCDDQERLNNERLDRE